MPPTRCGTCWRPSRARPRFVRSSKSKSKCQFSLLTLIRRRPSRVAGRIHSHHRTRPERGKGVKPEVGPALVWHYALAGCSGGAHVARKRSIWPMRGYGRKMARRWIAGTHESWRAGTRAEFGIELKSGGGVLGLTGLDALDADHASAELTFLLKVRFWGQVGATSLGAWPRPNQRRSRKSLCAARIRIYGLTPFRHHFENNLETTCA